MLITRRHFLKSSVALVPAYAFLPSVFRRAVASSILESPTGSAAFPDRTLVVVQMAGGNDGLNTLAPYSDNRYYDHRPNVAIPAGDLLHLNGEVGLHPAMSKLKELWDEGVLAIVEGVGYQNQSYSHFESMHIWQTGGRSDTLNNGWLGRYFDTLDRSQDQGFRGMAVGRILPPECSTPHSPIPVVESVALYQLQSDPRYPDAAQIRADSLLKLFSASPRETPYAVLLDNTMEAAYKSSQALQDADKAYKSAVEYPSTSLGKGLRLLSEAIIGDLGIRVGHVTIGGFDTHANQPKDHDDLLRTVSEALHAFYQDLKAHGKDRNVVIMTWSEFGRRVKSNDSEGTDHGSAAPLFILGTPVAGGLYGERPDLGYLYNDNLNFTTDFRTVYATVLDDWLGASSEAILGEKRLDTLPILSPP